MRREYGIFRPMNLQKPTQPPMRQIVSILQQQKRSEPGDIKYFTYYNVYGNSVQIGIPSPNNPIEINSTGKSEGALILNSGGGNISIPLVGPLRGLPNSIMDNLEYKKVGMATLNGIEFWNASAGYTNETYLSAYTSDYKDIKSGTDNIISSHFMSGKYTLISEGELLGSIGSAYGINIRILKSRLESPTVTGLREWLSRNNVDVHYELAVPRLQELIIPQIRDYGHPITSLNEIQPSRIIYERDGQTFETPLTNTARTLSIQALNALPDITDQEYQIFELGQENVSNLTEDDLAIGQLKNYTII